MTDHKVWRRDKQEPEPNASHGRVTRASTVTTITVIAAVAIFLYLIRRILLPFVLAGSWLMSVRQWSTGWPLEQGRPAGSSP